MIDFTASQAPPSAEHACPLRETILVDADQGGRVVRHDGHPRVDDRTAVPFVGEARRSTAPQARHEAFDHGAAGPTRVGELHLGRGPDILPARLAQEPGDVLRHGRRGPGSDCPGDPHREKPPRMPGLTPGGIIARQIAGQRGDGRGGARPHPRDRLCHGVEPGFHRAGITRMAHGQMPGKDKSPRLARRSCPAGGRTGRGHDSSRCQWAPSWDRPR